jgi:hypothetical protein
VIVGASVLVGLVAGGLFLLPPRVTVDSPGSFDGSDPLSAAFVIKNAWILPLRNVRVGIDPCNFRFLGITITGDCANPGAVQALSPSWKPHYLGTDEPITVTLGEVWNVPAASFGGGTIFVVVNFEIPLWPHTFKRPFRFVAERQRDGKFHWLGQPLN